METLKKRKIKNIIIAVSVLSIVGIMFFLSNSNQKSIYDNLKQLKTENNIYVAYNDIKIVLNKESIYEISNNKGCFIGEYQIFEASEKICDEYDIDYNSKSNIYFVKCFYNEHITKSEREYYNGSQEHCFQFLLLENDGKYEIKDNILSGLDFEKMYF